MRVVIQKVAHASVVVENQCVGDIAEGLLLFVGFKVDDTKEYIERMVQKIVNLRIFEDRDGKLNHSIVQCQGGILSVSQFTLYADCRKGNRPSFSIAAPAEDAKRLYEYFNMKLSETGIVVATGEFQADMKVQLLNDGPVTIVLDSEDLGWEK